MSTFDYLVKIIRLLGFSPEPLFRIFIEKVFSETETFLEEKVIDAVGSALEAKGISLSDSVSNADVIKAAIPATFMQTVKQKMAKELTVMIFGPREGSSVEALVPDPIRRNALIENSICGTNIFKLSNNPIQRNEDIEFNKIKLREQIEKGEIVFEVNCQDVKITLPEDPEILFSAGGSTANQSRPLTPAESVNQLVVHVGQQTQNINNQDNANAVGKSFFEILIEKLMSYITPLVIPYVGPIFSFLGTQNSVDNSTITPETVLYDNCSLESDPGNGIKQEFTRSLVNDLLRELLKGLLIFAIQELTNLVAKYFARTATEKLIRKADKIKQKFRILQAVSEAASRAQQYKAALTSLNGILNSI